MTMHARIAAISISLLAACSDGMSPIEDSSVPTDGAIDVVALDASDASRDSATPDAAHDSGFDSAMPDASDAAISDASADAADASTGVDASDAAPPCECATGPCCDGCNFRPATHVCAVNEPFPRSCDHSSMWCGSRALTLRVAQTTVHCSGASSACNGTADDTSFSVDCSQPTPGDFQQYGVCMPAESGMPARCALNCGF